MRCSGVRDINVVAFGLFGNAVTLLNKIILGKDKDGWVV